MIDQMPRRVFLGTTTLLTLSMLGCGGKPRPEGLPELYPVRFVVTQEGTPLADATVQFVPDGNSKWSTGGVTGTDGSLIPNTHGEFPGIPLGKYKVIVTKILKEGDPIPSTPMNDEEKKAWDAYWKSGKTEKQFNCVEKKYGGNDTPLIIEVKADSKEIPLDAGPITKEPIKVHKPNF